MFLEFLQQWQRSGGSLWTDSEGPAGFPFSILGQCIRHCQGLCVEVLYLCETSESVSDLLLWCLVLRHLVLMTQLTCLPLGSDHWDAAGGGGSEIHCCTDARSPLGQCKFSIMKSVLSGKRSVIQQVELLKVCPLCCAGWWCVREWASAACGWEDQEALQHQTKAQQHRSRSVSHYSKHWPASLHTLTLHAALHQQIKHVFFGGICVSEDTLDVTQNLKYL